MLDTVNMVKKKTWLGRSQILVEECTMIGLLI